MFKKILVFSLSVATSLVFTGCDDSDDGSTVKPVTSPFLICSGRNPGGVGIDLDSDTAWNIGDKADFDWDLRVKTFKGVRNVQGEPVLKGAPFIKLKVDDVEAATWTAAGNDAYATLTMAAVTTAIDESNIALAADPPLDLSDTDRVVAGDISGDAWVDQFYYQYPEKTSALKQKYAPLEIGETFKSGSMDTIHTNDPIYIIKSDLGKTFKLIVTDFGPNSDLGEPGYVAIKWEQLN